MKEGPALSAHRLSTIQEANKILVLKDRQIIEQGNYESSLKQKAFIMNFTKANFPRSQSD